jgi:hypothetical protein
VRLRRNVSLFGNVEDNCAYACAYRFVSARCLLLQFAGTTIRVICSALQFRAACFNSSSGTFDPKVAGSNPARPTSEVPANGTFLSTHGRSSLAVPPKLIGLY